MQPLQTTSITEKSSLTQRNTEILSIEECPSWHKMSEEAILQELTNSPKKRNRERERTKTQRQKAARAGNRNQGRNKSWMKKNRDEKPPSLYLRCCTTTLSLVWVCHAHGSRWKLLVDGWLACLAFLLPLFFFRKGRRERLTITTTAPIVKPYKTAFIRLSSSRLACFLLEKGFLPVFMWMFWANVFSRLAGVCFMFYCT